MKPVSGSRKQAIAVLLAAAALCNWTPGANAADLPTSKPAPAPPAPVVAPQPGFFVKLAFTYAINTSTSKLYSQLAPIPGAPQF
jgi:hypothetical protein